MNAWRSASALVSACDDNPRMRAAWPWPRVRRAVLRASAWVELAVGMGYVDEAGTAVLCLTPPRLRDGRRLRLLVAGLCVVPAFLVLTLLAAALLATWSPLLWLYGAGLVAVLARLVCSRWSDRAVRRFLARAKPAGGWYLHNFARHPEHKGAGWALLVQVVGDAQRKRRTLYLDTVAPRLVAYYEEAGFAAVAEASATYAGEDVVVTRMVRRPAS